MDRDPRTRFQRDKRAYGGTCGDNISSAQLRKRIGGNPYAGTTTLSVVLHNICRIGGIAAVVDAIVGNFDHYFCLNALW